MAEPVSSIRNLGPAMDEACAKAGIPSAEALREMGADEAYKRLLLSGIRPHFIGYYVLHMGLQGRPWNDCKGEEKKALRVRFDALKAEVAARSDAVPTGIERFLDQIGVGQKR
ncbi:TfoX/Sxy family protein [Marivita hallyeonensis]|uniref:TfoX C-terminal domain-containing protein n=1 Tax=Marivita hallyeonensis TaxID=996342 RepID=A0A1M5R966_9RHOB|nr:TfoX/Sxy family protein [Marivita hallyeonensis]SHH22907.1 TfoX C-terminal domain-containing protein [Marivita hallyeonensis]